jgi:cobalt-precorrin-5B (C1)-methyltransferase
MQNNKPIESKILNESLTDPVSGFRYPREWVDACQDTAALEKVRQGLSVLTAGGLVLARGYSTGTTAAAAAKAAVISLLRPVAAVRVITPSKVAVRVPAEGRAGSARAIKNPGDHPADITGGLEIIAEAFPSEKGCKIEYGEGIGRFSRTTPRYREGDPAVSPQAADCITGAVREAVSESGLPGVKVVIRVPAGRETAKKTLNERVGVFNGLSILGTTGFVEPWDDHLSESVWDRIGSSDHPVLTTGRIGMKFCRMLYPDRQVLLIGSRIGDALDRSPEGTILCGLPGLILRFIDKEICLGTSHGTVEELMEDPSCRERVDSCLRRYKERYPHVTVVLLDRNGGITGMTP